jgi:Zn-dependent membrane protease YugP
MNNWSLWLLLAGVPLVLGLLAQLAVKRTFAKYSEVSAANGMSGADAAAAVLRASGLPGLTINPIDGRLTDHYDPRSKTLNLSADVGQARSVAAIGVAAHEAGHAIQDAKGYWPMSVRQTLVPVANVGSTFWFMPVFLGFILQSSGLVTIGLALFAAVVLFQLITLPVEFDASHRALVALEENNLLAAGEIDGARAVLRAASLTYVAGFVAALGQLIYFFLASR